MDKYYAIINSKKCLIQKNNDIYEFKFKNGILGEIVELLNLAVIIDIIYQIEIYTIEFSFNKQSCYYIISLYFKEAGIIKLCINQNTIYQIIGICAN